MLPETLRLARIDPWPKLLQEASRLDFYYEASRRFAFGVLMMGHVASQRCLGYHGPRRLVEYKLNVRVCGNRIRGDKLSMYLEASGI